MKVAAIGVGGEVGTSCTICGSKEEENSCWLGCSANIWVHAKCIGLKVVKNDPANLKKMAYYCLKHN